MDDTILKLESITKMYGKNTVVKDFSMSLQKGHICGLIGPNGAGKTTIMKIIAGLARPDSGSMTFFSDKTDLDRSRSRMSFMLEAPIIDSGLTAYYNMQYVRRIKGVADKKKINELLEFTGLSDTGKKPAGKFSLGMKQRLGIAMALLTQPEIMVLDEPVNGLDPEGIAEIRLMLKKLAEEKYVSIIISSHILSELSELCTDFAIINHGSLIESLSRETLLTKCSNHITVRTDDINRTAAVIENKLDIHRFKVVHGEEIHIFEHLDDIDNISKTITGSGLIIRKLICEGESLEQYYLSKAGVQHE
ncbi:MAG: ATP-binding cassette domain-containing protein [Oscillospiraceae bacterium]|nr:ATP-binding cassette domain-containing protein [Oscillospiraceae bacterium]